MVQLCPAFMGRGPPIRSFEPWGPPLRDNPVFRENLNPRARKKSSLKRSLLQSLRWLRVDGDRGNRGGRIRSPAGAQRELFPSTTAPGAGILGPPNIPGNGGTGKTGALFLWVPGKGSCPFPGPWHQHEKLGAPPGARRAGPGVCGTALRCWMPPTGFRKSEGVGEPGFEGPGPGKIGSGSPGPGRGLWTG